MKTRSFSFIVFLCRIDIIVNIPGSLDIPDPELPLPVAGQHTPPLADQADLPRQEENCESSEDRKSNM